MHHFGTHALPRAMPAASQRPCGHSTSQQLHTHTRIYLCRLRLIPTALSQRLLAVHHASARLLAQRLDRAGRDVWVGQRTRARHTGAVKKSTESKQLEPTCRLPCSAVPVATCTACVYAPLCRGAAQGHVPQDKIGTTAMCMPCACLQAPHKLRWQRACLASALQLDPQRMKQHARRGAKASRPRPRPSQVPRFTRDAPPKTTP